MKSFEGRKGQSALEYMMTYGWAILVILVVGVVVWQMGILEPSTPSKDFRGFAQIKPLDWALGKSTETLQIVVSNDAGTIIDLTQVTADFEAGGSGPCTNWATGVTGFRPGAVENIQLTCANVIDGDVGDYYKLNVSISYTNRASSLTHLSYGHLWGPIE